jgi:hypothetical protein
MCSAYVWRWLARGAKKTPQTTTVSGFPGAKRMLFNRQL